MGKHRLIVLSGLLTAITIVLAACGGGDPTATPARTATPTARAAPTPSPALAATATVSRTVAPSTPSTPAAATTTPVAPPAGPPSPTATPRPAATPVSPPATVSGLAPKQGGVLQARFYVNPVAWDTYQACCGFTHALFQNVLNHLIRYKWNSISEIEGDLATSWEVGADGKTYTFRLRPGVQWQDGKPFTSADILYNFRRASDPKYTFNRSRVAPIASMEAPDPLTFKTTLKKVSASYTLNIASAFMLMYPAHVADPAAWQSAPVGTGAHRVSGATKDVSIDLTKNPNYFRKDAAGRQLPYLDGIKYTIIPDRALALAAFRAGRVHCGCTFDQDFMTDAEEQLLKELPGVKLGRFLSSDVFVQFNLQRPPLSNLAFRQAIAIGLDKDHLGSVLYRDKKISPKAPLLLPVEYGGQWALPKEELIKLPGFNPDHSKDLALARDKFKASGIDPTGVALSLLNSSFTGPDADGLASVLTTDLGLKVKGETVPAAEALTRRAQGNFQLSLETRGVTVDDPAEWFAGFLSTAGAFNFSKYTNPRIDELLVAQDAELDATKRRALIWEAQKIIVADFPIVPLPARLGVRGARAEVSGYSAGPVGHSNVRLDEVWLER